MLAAKGATKGLCPPDHFLDDNEENKKCKHDKSDCKCRTCDIYRANASGSYPERHWLHYDSDTYECCHCKKITFKFIVPNSTDNQTYMNIINQSRGQWFTTIGIGNNGTRTYDCKTKTWSGGDGRGGVF